MNIVGLIPARSGSKGFRDKNIQPLGGKPLIGIAAEAARGCSKVGRVYLDSDSEDYLRIGEAHGALPFRRPDALADDESTMQSVLLHFIETLQQQGEPCDAVIVLYPVYPFRTSKDICAILKAFTEDAKGRPLVGIKQPKTHPYLCYERVQDGRVSNLMGIDENRFYRRQQYPEYFELSHWACVMPCDRIAEANAQMLLPDTYGYPIEQTVHLVNIDSELDFRLAELMIQTGRFQV